MTSDVSPGNPPGCEPRDETRGAPSEPAGGTATTQDVLRLATDLVRRAAALGTQLAEQTGLHTTDVRALQVLDLASASDGLTMGGLAAELGISPQAASALLARLEARDLARRESFPGDRRRTRVVLGPAARAFGQQHLTPLATHLQAAAESLTPTERAAVVHFLTQTLDAPR